MKRICSWLWRFTLVTLLLLPLRGMSAEVMLKTVDVRVLNNNEDPEQIKKLIPFSAGEKTTSSHIEEVLSEINSLEIVEDVNYNLVPVEGGYHLQVEIVEQRTIRDILVGGNYPFLNRDIRRLIPLQPGTVYDETLIPKSIESIDNFLTKNGFYNSKIEISTKPHHKFNTLDLHIDIKKGKTYRVGKVQIIGNRKVSDKTLSNKISHGTRFRSARLKKNLNRIKKYYSKKGFIKARVKLNRLEYDESNRRVNIFIDVQENKRLKITFEGQTVLKPSRLKEHLNFDELRSYDRFSIRTGSQRLEQYYQSHGFPDAKVHARFGKTEDEVRVTYVIDAGHRVELSKIHFKGNKEISKKALKKRILSQESGIISRGIYRPSRLERDRERITAYYQSQGYLDVNVGEPVVTSNKLGDHKFVTFPINEGEIYLLRRIQIITDEPYPKILLRKASRLKHRQKLESETLEKAKARIYDQLHAAGYAYSTVEFMAKVDQDDHRVDLVINVKRGDKAFVRSIAVKGDHITKTKTILNNLSFKAGDVFVYDKVLDSQLNLRRLGIFSTVRLETLGFDDKATQIDILVYVHELKTNVLNFQAGFDNRNYARGEFSFTKRNLLGLAKQFNTRLIAGKKYDRAEVTFSSPRIFGANWNLANQYFAQYEDAPNFNANSYGAFISTLKNFGPHWTFGFKEAVTRTNVFEGESDVTNLGDALFDNTFNEFGTFLIFDNRDNFSDPQHGFYILLRDELNTDLSDASNTFDTVNVNISHHQGFWSRFTLNNTLRYGQHLKIANEPRIPVNKLFFMGGADTIRGFDEDELDPSGGTVFFVYNAELHLRVYNEFKLAGFFDAGFLSDNINQVGSEDIRESAGFGFRYFTPVGPVRLDYGFILDRRSDEPKSRLHFSFGYFF